MATDRTASWASVSAFLNSLSPDELLAAADNPGEAKKLLGELAIKIAQGTFVEPLSDAQIGERFPQFVEHLVSWRKLALTVFPDYRGPVAWRVKRGFTLKQHAPLAGPCYKNLEYLLGWDFEDTPTSECIVFWVPCLAPESTSKQAVKMEQHRGELRAQHKLPAHHCDRFGSIALLFALILAHFKRTGERVPLRYQYAASDTLRAGGGRLVAGRFGSGGLGCDYWNGSGGDDLVGFFLLGVEELGR